MSLKLPSNIDDGMPFAGVLDRGRVASLAP